MMLRIDRFIASAISLVRMPPDAPTSAPAMISAQLPMTKPAIATAVPVNAFSSEITTGMSAPPIGITIETPKISEATMHDAQQGRAWRVDQVGAEAHGDDREQHVHDAGAGECHWGRRDDALQLAGRDDATRRTSRRR